MEGPDWFETRAPAHPDWVRTRAMTSFRSGKDVRAVVVDDLAGLVWAAKAFARTVARRLARRDDRVVDVMAKDRRTGKVFVDWSQNDAGKSTITPYSLRGLWYPTVSTPVTWDEVGAAAAAHDLGRLVFLAEDVPPRLDRIGDPFAPVLTGAQSLPDLPDRPDRPA